MYYNPATNRLNNGETIAEAYRRAGLEVPDRTSAVHDAIQQKIGLSDLATVLGREAAEGVPDAAAWLDDALERVREAQAVDALRSHVIGALDAAQEARLPTSVDEAAEALGKAFKKTADTLAKVAPDLPQHEPFDLEQVVAADCTKSMKAAQGALADLTVWAGIHQSPHPDGYVSPALARLLPVVAIPECTPELVSTYTSITPTALTGQDLGATRAVRSLGGYADRHGVDAALLAVARGDWEKAGIVLSLATTADLEQRRQHAATAHTTQRVAPEPRHAAVSTIPTF